MQQDQHALTILDLCEENSVAREEKKRWIAMCCEAHSASAFQNNNVSKAICAEAGRGSLNFIQAFSAALLSTGGLHAPITQARDWIFHRPIWEIEEAVAKGFMIPGFGNSFFKDEIDPAWEDFEIALRNEMPDIRNRIAEAGVPIAMKHGRIMPNAAAFSAATCEIIGLPKGIESILFILGRAPVLAKAFAETVRNLKPLA